MWLYTDTQGKLAALSILLSLHLHHMLVNPIVDSAKIQVVHLYHRVGRVQSPNSNEGTYTVVLYIYEYFVIYMNVANQSYIYYI